MSAWHPNKYTLECILEEQYHFNKYKKENEYITMKCVSRNKILYRLPRKNICTLEIRSILYGLTLWIPVSVKNQNLRRTALLEWRDFYLSVITVRVMISWFGLVLWHINQCMLFDAKFSLYIYIKYIWLSLVGFYGISTIVGYLTLNPLYTYILNIYDLVWLGFMAYQPL